MKLFSNKFTAILAAIFLMLGFFVSVIQVDAQTKKKTTRKKKTTTSVPQPVPQQTVPVIVSTADQYQNQNQQLITGNTDNQTETQIQTEPETFDQKLDKINIRLNELNTRLNSVDSKEKREYEEKQKRLLLNLDILTRAEQRAESLRKQLFELTEKENAIRTKLEQIEYDLRPEMIERQIAFVGTLRPEELRDKRKKSLESEKSDLETLLTEIQTTRASLEVNVQKADQLVEKLRFRLEKDIDDALNEEQK